MGTTDTALRAGSLQVGYALLIEGFNYVLTDAADTAAVVTAYAGTGWTQVLPGLKSIGSIKQGIQPFKGDFDVPTMTFQVMDCDGADVFGKAVWKSKPTAQSRLNAIFTPAADGSGTLTVRDNAAFPASGEVFLGTRRVSYSAKVGSTELTVPAAGASTYSPFSADGSNHYSLPGDLAAGQNFDVAAPPRIGDVPAVWKGRKVALYMHRIRGGVWDVRAQAHLEFAGTIDELEDGEGVTVVTCHDLRKQIGETVLHRKQWKGYVKPGIFLRAGDKFRATEITTTTGVSTSSDFTVVTSGASTDDEVDEGLYDYIQFMERLSRWLAADSSLDGNWLAYCPQREVGRRTVFRAKFGSSSFRHITLECNAPEIFEFMGFTEWKGGYSDEGWIAVHSSSKDGDTFFIQSQNAPYRTRALQTPRNGQQIKLTVECTASEGEWFDHSDYLPTGIQGLADGENWSYVIIGKEQLAVAEYSTDTKLVNVSPIAGFGEIYTWISEQFEAPGVTFDEPADAQLEIRQVVYLTGKFSSLIPKLFASIGGTAGVNHATHDVFPFGAAVPWSLLGDDFVESCESLETTTGTDTIALRMDRPMRLKDVLLPELALRFGFLVFKDGGYQFVQPTTPSSLTADHTLDETNKAVGVGEREPMARTLWTSDYFVNVVKINREADHTGRFVGAPITVKDSVSIAVHGESAPVTINAVNSVSDRGSITGSTVEHLAGSLISTVFPMFARPVKLVTRSIAPTLYHMAPGDSVALTDDQVRDPTSGARGLSGRAGIVLESVHDYGHEGGRMMGEVTILLTDEDRTYPLSAAAEVDTSYTSGLYTNGYDNTNFRLKLKEHSFSASSDSKDVSSFANNDLVRIVELDPADPASIDAWSRTLHGSAAIDTSLPYIQMTAAISSPAWSGATKKFVVIPQAYASVQASQKLRAFQADDADGLIQDAAEPNGYGTQKLHGFAPSVATDLPALLADELYGDGKPLTPFQLSYLARGANNLVSYKTATHTPFLSMNAAGSSLARTSNTSWTLMWILPFFVGGYPVAGRNRFISVAPSWRSTTGDTVYCRIVSSRFPPHGSSTTSFDYAGAERYVDFTTTSTSTIISTAQDLPVVPAQEPGMTWLTMLLKATSPADCRVAGLPTLYLKPLA